MHNFKAYLLIIILLGFLLPLFADSGFQGKAFERKSDGSIGPVIGGVKITFTIEDGSFTRTATTNRSGYYRLSLEKGRYRVKAVHPDYEDYSSSPGFFVVTGDGYQTGNIFMRARNISVLLATTTRLRKDMNFMYKVNHYREILGRTEGLRAVYIEVNSRQCREEYGISASQPGNWKQIQRVLERIIQRTGASYIILLGGKAVVPRPEIKLNCGREHHKVASDAWYIDFNNDQVVDAGFTISRLPGLSLFSSSVGAALDYAAELHGRGGFSLDNEIVFGGNTYTAPPYGVCAECSPTDFFNLMSTKDYIEFRGHGKPTEFSTFSRVLIFSVDYTNQLDFSQNHPVITAFNPCYAGQLHESDPTLAYAFIKSGAAAYLANTTAQGFSPVFFNSFKNSIQERVRIGDAFVQAILEAIRQSGNGCLRKVTTQQFCLYGDPTLKRR